MQSVVLQCPSRPQLSLSFSLTLSNDAAPLVRANLSTRYTNYCVRVSVVTDLEEAGYSNHEVCAITGHQQEGSLAQYDRNDRKGSKRPATMTDVLDGKEAKRPCTTAVATCSTAEHAQSSGQNPSLTTIGGIHLSRNAVIHQLALNFTKEEGATDEQQIPFSSSQELTASVRK